MLEMQKRDRHFSASLMGMQYGQAILAQSAGTRDMGESYLTVYAFCMLIKQKHQI